MTCPRGPLPVLPNGENYMKTSITASISNNKAHGWFQGHSSVEKGNDRERQWAAWRLEWLSGLPWRPEAGGYDHAFPKQRQEDSCKLEADLDTYWLGQPGSPAGEAKCNLETVWLQHKNNSLQKWQGQKLTWLVVRLLARTTLLQTNKRINKLYGDRNQIIKCKCAIHLRFGDMCGLGDVCLRTWILKSLEDF